MNDKLKVISNNQKIKEIFEDGSINKILENWNDKDEGSTLKFLSSLKKVNEISESEFKNFQEFIRELNSLIVIEKRKINFLFGNGISLNYGSKSTKDDFMKKWVKEDIILVDELKQNEDAKKIFLSYIEKVNSNNIEEYFDLLANFILFARIYNVEVANLLEKRIFSDKDSLQNTWLKAAIGDIDYSFVPNLQIPQFLAWAFSQLQKNMEINIFNLNYDILIEKAADLLNYNINNGFDGNVHKKFNISNYNVKKYLTNNSNQEEKIKTINLANLHGSISWKLIDDNIVQVYPNFKSEESSIKIEDSDWNFAGILPNSKKFDNSMMNIYSDLFRFFKNSISEFNSSLVLIGYSLRDEHINSIIEDALNFSNMNLIIFYYPSEGDDTQEKVIKKFEAKATEGKNVTIICSKVFSDFNFIVKDILRLNMTKTQRDWFEELFSKISSSNKETDSNEEGN